MSQTGRSGDDGGFTVLELLIVLTLLSMCAAVVIGWIPSLTDRLVVSRSAQQVEHELSRSAREALSTGHDTLVIFDASSQTPMLIAADRTIRLDPTVEITWTGAREVGASSGQNAIVFLATGGASGGTVELRRGQAHATLEVDWLSGNVREE